MVKSKSFDYVVVGIGIDEAVALAQAEAKLPYKLPGTDHYASLVTKPAVEITGGQVKVEIGYTLREDPAGKKTAKVVRGTPSSFGGSDPFADTRDTGPIRDITNRL